MRKFWGFYDNGFYRVGCNGATIYVYDKNNKELGKFNDIKYAYVGGFKPNTNIFVAKSTEGSLAVYDFDKMELVKKIVITHIGAQDEGFVFSLDGTFFYNIEKPIESTKTQLTQYRTSDFTVSNTYFVDDTDMVLERLEFNDEICYVLGFMRGDYGVFDYGFIGKFENGIIADIEELNEDEYDYISAYKDWEQTGYTEKSLESSRLMYYCEKEYVSLKQVYNVKKSGVEFTVPEFS